MFGLSVEDIIASGGILIVSLIVFAESGLLIGFFLPGDTLLFSAGFFAGQGHLNIILLIAAVIVAAVVGDNVGYEIGKRAGKRVFTKEEGILFRREHIEKAEKFYEDHGGKTIILARFVPVVRTFAPVIAGMGKMPHKKFALYNVVGGTLWGAGVVLSGYIVENTVGKLINIDHYILPILGLVVLVSFASAFWHIFRDPKSRALLKKRFTKYISKPGE